MWCTNMGRLSRPRHERMASLPNGRSSSISERSLRQRRVRQTSPRGQSQGPRDRRNHCRLPFSQHFSRLSYTYEDNNPTSWVASLPPLLKIVCTTFESPLKATIPFKNVAQLIKHRTKGFWRPFESIVVKAFEDLLHPFWKPPYLLKMLRSL